MVARFTDRELRELAVFDAMVDAQDAPPEIEAEIEAREASTPETRRRARDREKGLAYYKENREACITRNRRYAQTHKDEIKAAAMRRKKATAPQRAELRAARLAAGLTQARAAELLGVNPSTYGGWESDAAPKKWWDILKRLEALAT